jgi:hypothetical protein
MARIPTLTVGQEVGSVQSRAVAQPFQSLRTSADMFGAAQGRALQQASEGLNNAATRLRDMAKQDDSNNLLKTQSEALSFSDNLVSNPETGLLTRKGEAAVGVTADAMKQFDDWASKLPEPSTASGKLAQQNYIARQKASVYQKLATHERAEREAVKKAGVATSIANAEQHAQFNYRNPAALAESESIVSENAGRLADYEGASPEAKEAIRKNAVSKMYVGVLQRMLSDPGNSVAARELYNKLTQEQKLQPGTEFNAITSALFKVETDAQGMALGLEAQNRFPNDPAAAAKWIASKTDVPQEVKSSALTFADQQDARVQRAEAQRIQNYAKELGVAASKGGDLDPVKLALLPGAQQKAITDLRDRARDPDRQTDRTAKTKFMMKTPAERGRLTPEEFVSEYWSKLSNADQDIITPLYSSGRASALISTQKELSDEQKSAETLFERQLSDMLDAVGLTGPNKKDDRGRVEAALRFQFAVDNGSRARTPAEIEQFLTNSLRKMSTGGIYAVELEQETPLPEGTLPGNLSRIPRELRTNFAVAYARSVNLEPGDKIDVRKFEEWANDNFFSKLATTKIPDKDRQQIIEALRKEGSPATETNIENRWRTRKMLDFLYNVRPGPQKVKPAAAPGQGPMSP